VLVPCPRAKPRTLTQATQGLSVVIATTLWTGAKCIVVPRFELEKACQLIQDHAISFSYVAPPIVLALGKHPVVDNYDLTSLRWISSGAAPLGRDLVETVWKRLNLGVKQGYGLSETSPTTHSQTSDEFWKFQGSVGKLFPNMEAKIVGEDGNEVAEGEVRLPFVVKRQYYTPAPMRVKERAER
jgi:4-coumarate--CoA ligase